VLLFALGSDAYAIRVSKILGLAACGTVRLVPGAPAWVVGLVEWRGNVLTVLDLPLLLGHTDGAAPTCLLPLAPPLQQTALVLPSKVRMAEFLGDPAAPGAEKDANADAPFEGCFRHEGGLVRLIDPARLAPRAEHRGLARG
jgi:chemotaxis signal transduction protein